MRTGSKPPPCERANLSGLFRRGKGSSPDQPSRVHFACENPEITRKEQAGVRRIAFGTYPKPPGSVTSAGRGPVRRRCTRFGRFRTAQRADEAEAAALMRDLTSPVPDTFLDFNMADGKHMGAARFADRHGVGEHGNAARFVSTPAGDREQVPSRWPSRTWRTAGHPRSPTSLQSSRLKMQSVSISAIIFMFFSGFTQGVDTERRPCTLSK